MSTRPSALQDHLGYWLRLISHEVSGSFARRVESQGVSVAQWVVLRLLFDRKDCSLVELTEAVGIDKGAVSRMIDRLIKLGWVRREASAKSRREIVLSLTPKAIALVPRLAREADRNDEAFFGVLSAADRSHLHRIIRHLAATHLPDAGKPPLH